MESIAMSSVVKKSDLRATLMQVARGAAFVVATVTTVGMLSMLTYPFWKQVLGEGMPGILGSILSSISFLMVLAAGIKGKPFLAVAKRIGLLPYSHDEAKGRRTDEVEQTAAIFACAFLAAGAMSVIGTSKFWSYLFSDPWRWIPAVFTAVLVVALEIMVYRAIQSGILKRLMTIFISSAFLTLCFGLQIFDQDIKNEKLDMTKEEKVAAAAMIRLNKEGAILRQHAVTQASALVSVEQANQRAQSRQKARLAGVNEAFGEHIANANTRWRNAPINRARAGQKAEDAHNKALMAMATAPDVDVDDSSVKDVDGKRDTALAALNAASDEDLLVSYEAKNLDGMGATMIAFFRVITKTWGSLLFSTLMFLFVGFIEAIPVIMLSLRNSSTRHYLMAGAISREDIVEGELHTQLLSGKPLVPKLVARRMALLSHFQSQIDAINDYRTRLNQGILPMQNGNFDWFDSFDHVRASLLTHWDPARRAAHELSGIPELAYLVGKLADDMFDGKERLFRREFVKRQKSQRNQLPITAPVPMALDPSAHISIAPDTDMSAASFYSTPPNR